MTNDSMPGIIKVGMSTKVPTERAKELEDTGLPMPYVVQYYAFFDDMRQAEKKAHNELSKYHYNKEFFKTDVGTAINCIENLGLSFNRLYCKLDKVELYKLALRVDPDDADAHFGLGDANLHFKDRGSALEEYKKLKELDSELADKLFDLIYKEEEELEGEGEGDSTSSTPLSQEDREARLREKINDISQKANSKTAFVMGNVSFETGRYEDAIESYKQAIEINPDFKEAHYNLGIAKNNSEVYRVSKERWDFDGYSTIKHDYNLKTIKGNKVVVDNATGLMWHQSGSDDEKEEGKAKEWVEDLNSEEGYAGYNDWRLPTVDEAASLLESSEKYVGLSIDPVFSNSQSHVWARDRDGTVVGWRVYFANGNERRNYIYSSLRCCVRPVRSDLSKDSGEELEEEDYDTIESYKQAIRINPDDASAHYNLGVTYYELGMYKEMIESCKQAIKIDPDDASVHNNLGLAYYKSGMYKEAIESFRQAIRIDPDDAGAHFNLGDAYLGLNDEDSALEQYEILKSLDSELANKLFDEINE